MSESLPPTSSKTPPTESLKRISQVDATLALQHVTQKLYKESLFLTCKYLLGYSDMTTATHGKMVNALEAETKRKLIVMPRGTFKSSISSVGYPIWMLLKNPNLRILLDSEVYSNSKNFLRVIKGHFESSAFINVFGNCRGSVWNEGEIVIAPRTKVIKEASITCSGIGAQKTGQHYDLIVADDLNSPKNSSTSEGRERVVNHVRFYTSLLEPGGTIVLVGTRYDANDAIGFILRNELGIDEAKLVTSALPLKLGV